MTAELPDFEPTTGHRHGCSWNGLPVRTVNVGGIARCDCAAELYCIAAQAEEAIHLKLENLGPMDGRHVLVARGRISTGPGSFGETLLKDMVRMATARGLTGPAAPHVPLVVVLPEEGQSLELLDEAEMRENGWYRSPGLPVKPMPAGPYS